MRIHTTISGDELVKKLEFLMERRYASKPATVIEAMINEEYARTMDAEKRAAAGAVAFPGFQIDKEPARMSARRNEEAPADDEEDDERLEAELRMIADEGSGEEGETPDLDENGKKRTFGGDDLFQ